VNRLAVLGHPIAHSLSPEIHQEFAQQLGYSVDYQKIDVSPGRLEDQVADLARSGALGCNITVPFKSEAVDLCDDIVPEARSLGVLNTLKFTDSGFVTGYNTDPPGLMADLMYYGIAVTGKRVLLVGAGGAAQGVIGALADQAPAEIHIWNRSSGRAVALAERLHQASTSAKISGELARGYDLVVNASAAGLSGQVPDLPGSIIGEHTQCYDLSYNKDGTAFLHWSEHHGAGMCVDGLGMLIEQAALAFEIWFGSMPNTDPLRSRFNARPLKSLPAWRAE
jgi:shikimate dehydrogenase